MHIDCKVIHLFVKHRFLFGEKVTLTKFVAIASCNAISKLDVRMVALFFNQSVCGQV